MRRKPNGYVVEPLEPRRMLVVTINGTADPDTISVEYVDDLVDHWRVIKNGVTEHHLLNGDLVVNGLGGNDNITILRTFDRFTTVSGGAGDDTITIGGGSFNSRFQQSIRVNGDGGTDTVVIHDERNTGTPSGLERGTEPGLLDFMVYDNTVFENTTAIFDTAERFVLRGGAGVGNFIAKVDSFLVPLSIRVEGLGGDDRCDFFRVGTVATTFEFDGGSGNDRLLYFQQGGGPAQYTVAGNSLTATASGQVLANWSNTQQIEIRGTSGSERFGIVEVNAGTAMTVNGGAGDDDYTIGGNDIDANIRGTLAIVESSSASGGVDSVLFNDGGTTPDTYTLGVDSFTKTGLTAPITFRAERRTLNANAGSNLIHVAADPAGEFVGVAAGAGNNALVYGAGDIRSGADVQFIGVTNLIFQDEGPNPAGVTDKDYTFGPTGMQYFVNGALATTFAFQGLAALQLFAGAYDSTITVNPIPNLQTLRMMGGAGDYEIILNGHDGASAFLDLDGEAGADLIRLNYADDTNQFYTITSTTFDKADLGLGEWNAEELVLITGTLANTIHVQSLGSGRSVTIHAGLGNDTLNLGTGDLDAIAGNVTFHGEGGTGDRIVIDDDQDTNVGTYSIIDTTFNRIVFGSLTHTGTETMELFSGAGANDHIVRPGTSLTNLIVRGGDGADSFTVTPSSTARITIDGDDATAFVDALGFAGAAPAGPATLTLGAPGAGTYSFASAQPVSFTDIDQLPLPPAAPGAADLIAADDTGISSTDNITNKRTVTFTGTAPAGRTVVIFAGTAQIGAGTAGAGGTYSVLATFASDGTFNVTAAVRDGTGLTSQASPPLSVTIDTVAPPAPTVRPDLSASSDTGVSSTDNITRDNTPTLEGTAPAGAFVRLLRNNVEVGFDPNTSGGPYAITTPALPDGLSNFVSRHEDVAGNQSGNSAILSVTIDTEAPRVVGNAFRFATAPHSLTYTFDENVGPTLDNADFALVRQPGTAIVTAMTYNAGSFVATLTFPVNGVLPEGRYASTLAAAGVSDIAGNALAADHVFNLLYLMGDANNDGTVNLQDFNVLASNFGRSNRTFAQGDFNYDGLVNLADFNLLATRFGTVLSPETTQAARTTNEVPDLWEDEIQAAALT